MKRISNKKVFSAIAGLFIVVLAGLFSVPVAMGADDPILVGVGEAVTIKVEKISKLAVADAMVADVAPLSDTEISVIGKKAGITTLTIVHSDEKPTRMHRVDVGNNVAADVIRKMIGDSNIVVRGIGDTLVLDGQVDNELQSQRAEQIAKAYRDKILNLIEVKNPRQIKIKMRVASVSKDASKKIGLKWLGLDGGARYAFEFTGEDNSINPILHGFVPTTGDSLYSVDVFLQLLEEKSWGRLLSEPTLITRSGTEASFMSGQEIPIDLITANTSTVEYKKVGVLMKIKPTADSQNRINTVVHAEVSQIDRVFGTRGNPVIGTRWADTVLQLADGQTMVIGGLLDNNIDKDALRKVPWMADIPVIGALFRHKEKSQTQSELLFFMTPTIIKDIAAEVAGAAKTPAMKDWNGGKANEKILEMPEKGSDWGLHDPDGMGFPESKKKSTDKAPAPASKEPATNIKPVKPAGK